MFYVMLLQYVIKDTLVKDIFKVREAILWLNRVMCVKRKNQKQNSNLSNTRNYWIYMFGYLTFIFWW